MNIVVDIPVKEDLRLKKAPLYCPFCGLHQTLNIDKQTRAITCVGCNTDWEDLGVFVRMLGDLEENHTKAARSVKRYQEALQGSVYAHYREIVCNVCEGVGLESGGADPCSVCKGTGYSGAND